MMPRVRRLIRPVTPVLLFTTTVMLVGQPATAREYVYDAQELVRGLAFGSGPVAKLLPEVWDNLPQTPPLLNWSQEQWAAHLAEEGARLEIAGYPEFAAMATRMAQFLNENPDLDPTPYALGRAGFEAAIFDGIQELRPDLLENLPADAQSGNPIDVNDVLVSLYATLLDTWDYLNGPLDDIPVYQGSVAVDVWVFLYLAVAAAAVAVVIVAVLSPNGVPSGLEFEQLVDLIANRLYVRPLTVNDDFDLFQPGGVIGQGEWMGWLGSAQSNAEVVGAPAHTLPYAIRTTPSTDIVRTNISQSAGEWSTWLRVRIPGDATGAHVISYLSEYDAEAAINISSACLIDATARQIVHLQSGNALPLQSGRWVLLQATTNLDTNSHTLHVDNELLFEGLWSQPLARGDFRYEAIRIANAGGTPIFIDDLLVAPIGSSVTAVGDPGVPRHAPASVVKVLPNPFNPSTQIEFTLPRPAHVDIRILDVRGRLVRHLTSGDYDAGQHVVAWDGASDVGADVASGTYVVHLESEEVTASTKLSLVR